MQRTITLLALAAATVFFAKRIRDELDFSTPEEMEKQLKSDLAEVNELIY